MPQARLTRCHYFCSINYKCLFLQIGQKVAQAFMVGVIITIYITKYISSITLIKKVEVRSLILKYNFQNVRKGNIVTILQVNYVVKYIWGINVYLVLLGQREGVIFLEPTSNDFPRYTNKSFSRCTSSPHNTCTYFTYYTCFSVAFNIVSS